MTNTAETAMTHRSTDSLMTAIVQDRYGSADVLQLRAIEQSSLQDRLAKLEHLAAKLIPDSSDEETVRRRKPPRHTAW